MQFLRDHVPFLRPLVALLAIYSLYVWFTGRDPIVLALGLVLLGTAALLLVAYRFRDDFAPESGW